MVMDEPTSGLDPASRRQVRAVVRAVVGAGTSVLLSSHSMVEVGPSPTHVAQVDCLCDRLAVLVGGRVRAQGAPDTLKHRLGGGYKVSLKLAAGVEVEELAEVLAGLPGLVWVGQRRQWVTYRLPGHLSSVLGLLATARTRGSLEGFTINMASLEDIFLEVTGGGEEGRGSPGEPGPPGEESYDPLAHRGDPDRLSQEEATYIRPESVERRGEEEKQQEQKEEQEQQGEEEQQKEEEQQGEQEEQGEQRKKRVQEEQ